MLILDKIKEKMEPAVFFGSAAVVVGFVIFGATFSSVAADWFSAVQSYIARTFGWYYALTATGFLVFSLWLMLSPYGRIRLGDDDDRPQFSRWSWFTMLFGAGMGTGLVFWSVAEPIRHYLEPPVGVGAESTDAIGVALRYTFFHWGLHPWAIYSVFGVALAYFHFRRKLPLRPRSILHPLIGERIHGPIGHAVDILCTVGTLLGVATSLGLGAMQVNTGLADFTNVPLETRVQLAIVAAITLVATISVVAGVHAGIRRLSRFNIGLAAVLFGFVLLVGPTVFILKSLVTGLGLYLQNLPRMSLNLEFGQDFEWQAQWTLFYWGWWISWSPFVGVFVGRISRGRTVREFILGVLMVPTLVTFAWLAVFGGSALHEQHFGGGGLSAPVREDAAQALHALLGTMPLSLITSITATLLIAVFFVTSSDSGSLVDDMVTSGGHPNPPRSQRVFWAVSEGAVAATLLLAGGLQAIQSAAISAGLPMSVLLVAICVSLMRAFRQDASMVRPASG